MRTSLCFAAALLLPIATPLAAQTAVPIQFARGASAATLTGSIKGQGFTDYKITVREGQRLSVRLTGLAGSPYFNLFEPGSQDVAIYNSSMGEQTFAGTTARSGAYTIRVYQMRASGRRGEVAKFRLEVSVTGGTQAVPAHRPADALVKGTPYHATALIACRTVTGGAMGSCKAGVVRRSGSATVHLDTPDGGERTILFRDGRAVSSDSDAGLVATRRGDTSIVRIGTVEVYEVPDALVEGG